MRETIGTQHFAGVKLTPQDFQAMNRGDMFFPSVSVNAGIPLGIMASPYMGQPMNVHSIPVTYLRPNANTRTHNSIGMATPEYKGG